MEAPRESRLEPVEDVAQADWVRERLVGFGDGVYSLVPAGFPAYVRLFHPAYEPDDPEHSRPVTWSAIAARAGTTMHALAQFDPLSEPLNEALDGPDDGNLDPEVLRILCGVLGRHTSRPEKCWFCLWSGYGWLHPEGHGLFVLTDSGEPPPAPPPRPPFPDRPLVELPGREYLLFSGPIEAALDSTWGGLSDGFFGPQSPNLFWPDDRGWCVATEIDLDSTYIGCSESLAQALLSDPRLEIKRVEPDDRIAWDSDEINGRTGGAPSVP